MQEELIKEIELTNSWLVDANEPIINIDKYIPRIQTEKLLSPEWDNYCLVLTGPRQAGKTTLGKYLCHELIQCGRYKQLLYLNCDYLNIRRWLKSPTFISEAIEQFRLQNLIIFIDEVQRLDNPGLLLKSIVDLKLPIKLIASGSSQLEIKSKVQEYLTGRQFECVVLPFSYAEYPNVSLDARALWGCYPGVISSSEKSLVLAQLYSEYIKKDIIEILKVENADAMQKLITLIAHSSGQLVRYQQLATDVNVSTPTVQRYLSILENTYVIKKITPFVGNKRSEITANPIYYFIDNGFHNQALRNFNGLESRVDRGFLVESLIFQEIYKFREQHFHNFDIHFWRTTSGAEVDFVLVNGDNKILPIEVKYQNISRPTISKSFRSFLQAYEPKLAIYITKNIIDKIQFEKTMVHFISINRLDNLIQLMES